MHIFFVLVAVSIPALFLRTPSSPHVHRSRPYYQFSTSENCGDICNQTKSESSNTFILRLLKPWHHFDSNHWFHVSEYYLSRHQTAQLAQVTDDSTLIIVSDDPGFTTNVTEMTLFIMMLSFTHGKPKNVFVIEYTSLVPVKSSAADSSMHIFEYSGPIYQYKRDLPYFERYHLMPAVNDSSVLGDVISSARHAPLGGLNGTTGGSNAARRRGLERCTCGHFVGELGAAPINRGYWFGGSQDVSHQREKLSMLCPSAEVLYQESSHDIVSPFIWTGLENFEDKIVVKQIHRKDRRSKNKKEGKSFRSILLRGPENGNGTSTRHGLKSTNKTKRGYKMVVYQRDEDRMFLYFEYMLKTIKSNLPKWTIEIMFHVETLEPCMLKSSLQDADIFLTTHGFQSMSVLFMKKGSLIMEVFPFRYWKEGYKPLAEEYGVHHRWMQSQGPVSPSHYLLYLFSQKQCMRSHWCRDFSRNEDIIMTPSMLKSFLGLAKDIESNKLGEHNAPAIFGVNQLAL